MIQVGDVLSFKKVDVILIEDQILHHRFKEDVTVTHRDVVSTMQQLGEAKRNKRFANLVELQPTTVVAAGAHNAAADPRSNEHTIAEAIIVQSLPQRVMGNLYVMLMKGNKIPTRLFSNKAKALAWLRRQVIKEEQKNGSLLALA